MTLQELQEYGADTADGMERCMNNEGFYFKMIGMALNDGSFDKLGGELQAEDLDSAFETAHALKGVYGNLALTPIFEPIQEITENLRSRTKMDYAPLYAKAKEKRDELIAKWS